MMKYVLFVLIVFVGMIEAKMQNISVKGTVVCEKHRIRNVLVQLMEKDTIDSDDLLAEVHSNNDGDFFLQGQEDEITSIAPYLRIHHHCQVSVKPGMNCTRTTEYIIPKSYIDAPRPYDMTYVTLDIFAKDEKEKCVKIKN